MGLRAGERISVRDLLYGLILRSGNDAAHDLALAAAGSQAAFVAADEPPRRRSRPRRHPLREPDRPRPARQLLQRRRPGDAEPGACCGCRPSPRSPTAARRCCAACGRRGGSRLSTTCSGWRPGSPASRPATPSTPATSSSASGRRKGVELISVAIGAPTDEARYTRQPGAARIRASRSTASGGRSTRARTSPIRRSATRAASCRCGPRARSASACAAASGSRSRSARPARSRGRSGAEPSSGPQPCLRRRPPGRRGAAAGRPHDRRGEHLRPRPRLRR